MAEIEIPDNHPLVEQWRQAVAALARVSALCDEWGYTSEAEQVRDALDGGELAGTVPQLWEANSV